MEVAAYTGSNMEGLVLERVGGGAWRAWLRGSMGAPPGPGPLGAMRWICDTGSRNDGAVLARVGASMSRNAELMGSEEGVFLGEAL